MFSTFMREGGYFLLGDQGDLMEKYLCRHLKIGYIFSSKERGVRHSRPNRVIKGIGTGSVGTLENEELTSFKRGLY